MSRLGFAPVNPSAPTALGPPVLNASAPAVTADRPGRKTNIAPPAAPGAMIPNLPAIAPLRAPLSPSTLGAPAQPALARRAPIAPPPPATTMASPEPLRQYAPNKFTNTPIAPSPQVQQFNQGYAQNQVAMAGQKYAASLTPEQHTAIDQAAGVVPQGLGHDVQQTGVVNMGGSVVATPQTYTMATDSAGKQHFTGPVNPNLSPAEQQAAFRLAFSQNGGDLHSTAPSVSVTESADTIAGRQKALDQGEQQRYQQAHQQALQQYFEKNVLNTNPAYAEHSQAVKDAAAATKLGMPYDAYLQVKQQQEFDKKVRDSQLDELVAKNEMTHAQALAVAKNADTNAQNADTKAAEAQNRADKIVADATSADTREKRLSSIAAIKAMLIEAEIEEKKNGTWNQQRSQERNAFKDQLDAARTDATIKLDAAKIYSMGLPKPKTGAGTGGFDTTQFAPSLAAPIPPRGMPTGGTPATGVKLPPSAPVAPATAPTTSAVSFTPAPAPAPTNPGPSTGTAAVQTANTLGKMGMALGAVGEAPALAPVALGYNAGRTIEGQMKAANAPMTMDQVVAARKSDKRGVINNMLDSLARFGAGVSTTAPLQPGMSGAGQIGEGAAGTMKKAPPPPSFPGMPKISPELHKAIVGMGAAVKNGKYYLPQYPGVALKPNPDGTAMVQA